MSKDRRRRKHYLETDSESRHKRDKTNSFRPNRNMGDEEDDRWDWRKALDTREDAEDAENIEEDKR